MTTQKEILLPLQRVLIPERNVLIAQQPLTAHELRPTYDESYYGTNLGTYGDVAVHPVRPDTKEEIRDINKAGGITNNCTLFAIYKGLQTLGLEIKFSHLKTASLSIGVKNEDLEMHGIGLSYQRQLLELLGCLVCEPIIKSSKDLFPYIKNGYVFVANIMELWPDDLNEEQRLDFHDILIFGSDEHGNILTLNSDYRYIHNPMETYGIEVLTSDGFARIAWEYPDNGWRNFRETELKKGTSLEQYRLLGFRLKKDK